jgi:hypothetical protein
MSSLSTHIISPRSAVFITFYFSVLFSIFLLSDWPISWDHFFREGGVMVTGFNETFSSWRLILKSRWTSISNPTQATAECILKGKYSKNTSFTKLEASVQLSVHPKLKTTPKLLKLRRFLFTNLRSYVWRPVKPDYLDEMRLRLWGCTWLLQSPSLTTFWYRGFLILTTDDSAFSCIDQPTTECPHLLHDQSQNLNIHISEMQLLVQQIHRRDGRPEFL